MGESRFVIRRLGLTDYKATWKAMQAFTAARNATTADELWLTEHPPVYTQGLNKKDVAPPLRHDIPLVMTDRGGKITYHGPGQIVIYVLCDLQRRGLTVRRLVSSLEDAVIGLLGPARRRGAIACRCSRGLCAREKDRFAGIKAEKRLLLSWPEP